MAKATSSRESSSKTEVSVYSETLADSELAKNHPDQGRELSKGTDSQNGNIEKRAHRASAARHARKCTVCHHKDREFIDQDYLRWLSPKKIAREYKISHHSVVYRHADATGLRAQRRASLRATLENFIEQAESVRATAGSVVAAVRLYAQINDQGQWVPPVRRHIVEHRYVDLRTPASVQTEGAQSAPAESPAPAPKRDGVTPLHTFTAHSAVPLGVSPERLGVVPQMTDGLPSADSACPEESRRVSAQSTEPTGASRDKFGSVPPERNARATQTTGGSPPDRLAPLSSNAADFQAATNAAQFAASPAQAHKNSGSLDSTRRFQRVATITAGSAVPQCASPEKFPAVPVASINFASDPPISNREHLELEHAATH